MKIAFVMDPIESVDIDADTTFALMFAAQEAGHEVHYLQMHEMEARGRQAWGKTRHVTLRRHRGDHVDLGGDEAKPLHEFDAIFMRKDPPFDVPYLHATHLLELAEREGAFVLNKPSGLRGANEKLYTLHFEEVMPATRVTRDKSDIKAFLAEQGGTCILKPVDGHGGEGVLVLREDDKNLNALIELTTKHGKELAICQQYLPEAREGDKRIIMLNGQPLGGILRVPSRDEHRGNIHVGGTVEKTELTPRDLEICERVGPRLAADGLYFVGLGVIGGYLTEVNVTSPTGIQEMSRLNGIDGSAKVIEWIAEQCD
jgi:glutathione synthase